MSTSHNNPDIAEIRRQAVRNLEYGNILFPWSSCRNMRRTENNRKTGKLLVMLFLVFDIMLFLVGHSFTMSAQMFIAFITSVTVLGFAMSLSVMCCTDTLRVCTPGNWTPGQMYRAPRASTCDTWVSWCVFWPFVRFPHLKALIRSAEATSAKPETLTHFCTLMFPTRIANVDSDEFPDKLELSQTREYAEMYFDAHHIYFHYLEVPGDAEAQ